MDYAAGHQAATLDIVPTYDMFQRVNKEFATSNYHWFFLMDLAVAGNAHRQQR